MSRYIVSKWKKTQALLGSSKLSEHIPETSKLEGNHLRQMLEKHRMVYVKPDSGSFGNRVIRIEMTDTPQGAKLYSCQSGTKKQTFDSFTELQSAVKALTRGKLFLVQQGIHLLSYRGNRFDLRVMVQRDDKMRWVATGLAGRVADPTRIVTNYHNGGTLEAVETLLSPYIHVQSRDQYIRNLKTLGHDIAKQLSVHFPGIREIGVDVALDTELKPWILEVNTKPDPYIFGKLKDESNNVKQIMRYNRLNKTKRKVVAKKKKVS